VCVTVTYAVDCSVVIIHVVVADVHIVGIYVGVVDGFILYVAGVGVC